MKITLRLPYTKKRSVASNTSRGKYLYKNTRLSDKRLASVEVRQELIQAHCGADNF